MAHSTDVPARPASQPPATTTTTSDTTSPTGNRKSILQSTSEDVLRSQSKPSHAGRKRFSSHKTFPNVFKRFFKPKPTFSRDAGLLSIATGTTRRTKSKMSVFCQKICRISAREASRRKSSGWRCLDPSSLDEQASQVPWDVRAFQSPFYPCLKQVGTPGAPLGPGGHKSCRIHL